MDDDSVILVCALADHPHIVVGSVFTHSCAVCQRGLVVAPDGQQILRKFPQAKTMCGRCFLRLPDAAEIPLELAAGVDGVRDEERQTQPNLHRRRN